MRWATISWFALLGACSVASCGGVATIVSEKGDGDVPQQGVDSSGSAPHAEAQAPVQDAALEERPARLIGFALADAEPDGAARDAAVCAVETREVEYLPIDLFLLVDKGDSMAQTLADGNSRWKDVTDGINAFVSSMANESTGVGLQYFGVGNPTSCDPVSYGTPDVAIQSAATAAPLIAASIAAHAPSGSRALGPALQGGLAYAQSQAQGQFDRSVRVVLLTDGEPNACTPLDVDGIAGVAAASVAGTPFVSTYVLALGPPPVNLDPIADAGNTQHAITIVDSGDVKAQVVKALTDIIFPPGPCHLVVPALPDGAKLDPRVINLVYRYRSGESMVLVPLPDVSGCSSKEGGWYYDDPAHPTSIAICPVTCAGMARGTLDILLGCGVVVVPP